MPGSEVSTRFFFARRYFLSAISDVLFFMKGARDFESVKGKGRNSTTRYE